MLEIFLCDDNESILSTYKELLIRVSAKHNILVRLHTFTSGERMFFHIDNNQTQPDIVYLDILMENENGIDVAKQLRKQECISQIIFLTANPEYVFDSFDVSPINYIVKGEISDNRFEDIFLRAVDLANQQREELYTFTTDNNTVKHQLKYKDILYFEIINRVISVHTQMKTYSYYGKMDDLEGQLKNFNFVRVHRSYLVHTPYIEMINRHSITLVDGETIPIGVTYIKNVKEAFRCYMDTYL